MNSLPPERHANPIADQKLLVLRQQEIVAQLFRSGQRQRAREARGKLFALLNQLDLMQEIGMTAESRG